MDMATCKLCLEDKKLRNSHIIPEFMYESLYDEIHRFNVLSVHTHEFPKLLQKGIREHLLCQECETALSVYERYVSQLFKGELDIQTEHDGKMVTVYGLDYKKFKLFSLSVLWRASISTDVMFKDVTLGPHEETLRTMILKGDPGEVEQYPFMLAPITFKNENVVDLMIQPTKTRTREDILHISLYLVD
jgi:hypothetical protein